MLIGSKTLAFDVRLVVDVFFSSHQNSFAQGLYQPVDDAG